MLSRRLLRHLQATGACAGISFEESSLFSTELVGKIFPATLAPVLHIVQPATGEIIATVQHAVCINRVSAQ